MEPKVSVTMAVYNGASYLREAIDSMLAQSFADFEFIIVDDGSTDSTAEILSGYDDNRIVALRNAENLGLTRSLNICLRGARGEYVARMDADDIAHPRRLERQVEYLDRHPEVGLLGTWIERIDDQGNSIGVRRLPTGGTFLRWGLLFGTPIAHPSVMFRRELARKTGYYDEKLRYAQDHELWVRLSFETVPAQLPEPLLRLRRHSRSISAQRNDEQWRVYEEVSQSAVERLLGTSITIENIRQLRTALQGHVNLSADELRDSTSLLIDLYRGFVRFWGVGLVDRLPVRLDLARRLVALARRSAGYDRATTTWILARAVLADPRIVATRPFWSYLASAARAGIPL